MNYKIVKSIFRAKGGLLAKYGKLIFQGRSFLEGKIQKNGKNFLKIFNVPKRLLGHTDHLYTGAPIGGTDNQCHEASRLFD